MESQRYQDVALNEKASEQSQDTEFHGPCKAHQKRQNLKNATYILVVVFVWWYFNTIPYLLRMNWRPTTIEAGPHGRHMSFDSVRNFRTILKGTVLICIDLAQRAAGMACMLLRHVLRQAHCPNGL